MTLSDQALDALLKRLHLANTRRAWRDLTQRAEQEEWTYRDLLALVVSEKSRNGNKRASRGSCAAPAFHF